MFRAIPLFFILIFFTSLLYAQHSRPQDEAIFSGLPDETEEAYQFHKKPNIAVLPFLDANAKAKETEYGRTVSAMLITALRNGTNFSVIERSELQKILSEQVLDLSGLTKAKAQKIRDLLQVDVILVGDVSLIENTLHVDARLFDISTSQVVAALYESCQDLSQIRKKVKQLAKNLEQTYLRQWMGKISIASQLPDAEVYLDDRFVGKTQSNKPLQITDLLEGKYNLKLIRGGYNDWQGEIIIMAKMDRSVRVQLIPKPGSMNIYSEPDGAKIFLDNTYVGVTPISLKKVAEGEHEIRLLKINFKPWTRKVMVRSFQPTDVKTTLEVSPGMITVNSDPDGAEIYLKGKFVARTPYTLSNIEPGEVVLRVGKAGFEEWTTSTFVKPNGHEVLDVKLKEKVGNLTVTSKPEGAEIFLSRSNQKPVLIGETPLLNYTTTIGSYNIQIKKKDYFNKVKSVTVRTGALTESAFQLKQKPGSIMVETKPENARVFLDGIYKGRAPLHLEGLEKGKYLVTMSMPYASETVKVTVKSNREARATAELEKPFNYVLATSLAGLSVLFFHYLAN